MGVAQTVMLTDAEQRGNADTGSRGLVSANRLRACSVTSAVPDSRAHGPRPARLLIRRFSRQGAWVGCHCTLSSALQLSSLSCPRATGWAARRGRTAHASQGPSRRPPEARPLGRNCCAGAASGMQGPAEKQDRLGQCAAAPAAGSGTKAPPARSGPWLASDAVSRTHGWRRPCQRPAFPTQGVVSVFYRLGLIWPAILRGFAAGNHPVKD